MKNILVCCALLFVSVASFGQLPSDFRSEQIFISPASTVLSSMDSILVEGMVTCDAANRNKPYSKYIYIELIGGNDSLLGRNKVRCDDNGFFRAAIPQDPTSEPGVYYLRAYTNLMRNFSMRSFAVQPLLINRTFSEDQHNVSSEIWCTVYPHGGKAMYDIVQSFTAYLFDERDEPVAGQRLDVVSNLGDTICTCSTSASGLASFSFIPQRGYSYNVVCSWNGNARLFPMPEFCRSDEVAITASLTGKRLKYTVFGKPSADCCLYIYDRWNGLQKIDRVRSGGVVLLQRKPYVATAFLADRHGNVMSEFTAVGKSAMDDAELQVADTFSIGEDIVYNVVGMDSVLHTMARLVPYNDCWNPNMERSLVYESDFESPIPFPAKLFEEERAVRRKDLQIWLATASFKRFSLRDALANGDSLYRYMPEEVMSFSGVVKSETGGRIGKGSVVIYNTVNGFTYDAEIGSDGRFAVAVDDFDDGTTFFIQALDKYGHPVFSRTSVDDVTFPPVSLGKRYRLAKYEYVEESTVDIVRGMCGRTLPNVVVKARVRRDAPVSAKKFYSVNYADREKIEEADYHTLYDILKQMPGIMLVKGDPDIVEEKDTWAIKSVRGISTLKGCKMVLLVDGVRVDVTDAQMQMPAFDIESVEVLKPYQALAYTFGAIDGAVAVATRKAGVGREVKSKGTYYTPMGLSKTLYRTENSHIKAVAPGYYRLLVDVQTASGVRSFEHVVTVVGRED